MAYNRDSTRRNGYVLCYNPYNYRNKNRALDLAVASAIGYGQLPAGAHTGASEPRDILVCERGKIRRHRLPQWYDPLVTLGKAALAAGGIVALLSGMPVSAQEPKTDKTDAALDAALQAEDSGKKQEQPATLEEYLKKYPDKKQDYDRYVLVGDEKKKFGLDKDKPMYDRMDALAIARSSYMIAEGIAPYNQFENLIKKEIPVLIVKYGVEYLATAPEPAKRDETIQRIKTYIASEMLTEQQKEILRKIPEASKELADYLKPAQQPTPPVQPQVIQPPQQPVQPQPPQTPVIPPPVQPQVIQPPQPPAQPPLTQPPAQPLTPPVQPRTVPGQVILPDDPLFWSTLKAASYKSLQTRETQEVLRTGLVDFYGQGHIRKDKEEVSRDPRRTSGAGGHALLDIGFMDFGVTESLSKYRRRSGDHDETTAGGVIITTDTDGLEEVEREYRALTAGLKFGDFRIHATYRDAAERNSITTTVNGFVDSPDPIGDYPFTIVDENDFDVTTRGAQVWFGYDWAFNEDDRVLDSVGAKAVGDVEQIEIGLNDTKYRTWRVDFVLDALSKDAAWGVSASVGTRLIEDAEEQSRYSRVHGSLNAAADLDTLVGKPLGIPVPATLFGSFWRLDQPYGGAGLVFGEGNAVRLMMDYSNQRAWHELELSKELGPEERKVKMDLLNYDLLRGLTADPKLRLLLFGGVRRNEDAGVHDYDWTAQAALVLPASDDVVFALDGVRDKVGIEEILRAGLNVRLPGGMRFGFWGGRYKVEGALHDDAPIFGISGGVDF